jgi:hypothetical protein
LEQQQPKPFSPDSSNAGESGWSYKCPYIQDAQQRRCILHTNGLSASHAAHMHTAETSSGLIPAVKAAPSSANPFDDPPAPAAAGGHCYRLPAPLLSFRHLYLLLETLFGTILAEPGLNLLAAPPAKAANAVNSHPSGGAAPKPSWPPPDSNDPFSDLGQLPPPIRR